jgi:acyl-CoA synthetase (NDP forming)
VLKVGKSERARHSITTHTGGLAGESAALSAILAAHHAIEVDTLTELTEVLAAAQGRHWPKGRRLSILTGSGGQAELILDIAGAAGIDLPPLQFQERAEVERVVGHVTGDGNPLDAWGNGDPNTNYPHALDVLSASSQYDAVAMLCDGMDGHPLDQPSEDLVYAHMAATAAAKSDKPFFLLSTRSGVFRSDQEQIVRPAGIAVVSGIREGLNAIGKLATWHAPVPKARQVQDKTAHIPSSRPTINEHDSKALLAQAGVRVAREELCKTLQQASKALAAFEGTVVLKIASDDIAHKSEYGLVELGIDNEVALEEAWSRIEANAAKVPGEPRIAGILVQEMVREGIEVFVGISRDPDFGLLLAFGLGGVLVEITKDVSLRPLPLREGDAEAMIAETSIAFRLLSGVRGQQAADIDALAAAIYAFADFAFANRELIDEIDVNPIKVLPKGRGCVAVDALIVPRRARS